MKKTFIVILIILCSFSVFAADADHARPYNKGLDIAGTVIQLSTMATAAILLKEGLSEYPILGVMGIETFGLAYGTKELLKHVVVRQRPYTYFPGAPVEEIGEWAMSFPSGHVTLAFSYATFTSYVFCKYNPDSRAKIPVCIISYSLACATGILRVACGSHFVTDVLAGAAIGAAIGFVVPYIHTRFANNNISASVSPFGFAFKISL